MKLSFQVFLALVLTISVIFAAPQSDTNSQPSGSQKAVQEKSPGSPASKAQNEAQGEKSNIESRYFGSPTM